MPIERVEAALEAIRAGRMVILVDDEDRENEGDLVLAAERVSPDAINFMAQEGRGLICLTLTEARCRELDLSMMVGENTSPLGTAFTVSIEAVEGVTTGISAADRSQTIKVAIADSTRPSDLSRPGHVFPLRAREGGVLVRTGQTEGSVDLARLAGLKPAGVICEIMKSDGSMARRPDLEVFAKEHDLILLSVADLIDYRMARERLVRRRSEGVAKISGLGPFRVIAYESVMNHQIHLAFVRGEWGAKEAVLTRVQNRELLGDLLSSARGDGGPSLFYRALQRIDEEEKGVLVCLRGNTLSGDQLLARVESLGVPRERVRSPGEARAQEAETEVHSAATELRPDLRDYGIGAQILRDLGVTQMRLMTNTPMKIVGIEGFGLEMVEQVALTWTKGDPAYGA